MELILHRLEPLRTRARQAYRAALCVDDVTGERGKAWVLTGVYGISYYRDTPVLVGNAIRAIEAVLADSD